MTTKEHDYKRTKCKLKFAENFKLIFSVHFATSLREGLQSERQGLHLCLLFFWTSSHSTNCANVFFFQVTVTI